MITTTPATDYCVIYRRGGESNFTWHRSLPMTHTEAIAARASVELGGRYAMTERYSRSVAIGLPETYCPTQDHLSAFGWHSV